MTSSLRPCRTRRRLLGYGAGSLLVLALGGLTACGSASASQVEMVVDRDPGCVCCEQWARQMAATGHFGVRTIDDVDIATFKRGHGVPADLASCHTALVAGYVIEGHVPANDIERLLRERPEGVVGIAVAGMPIGSPGMDQPGMGRDAYDVVAFRRDQTRFVFAHYPRTT